jgi:hypothetical protein
LEQLEDEISEFEMIIRNNNIAGSQKVIEDEVERFYFEKRAKAENIVKSIVIE